MSEQCCKGGYHWHRFREPHGIAAVALFVAALVLLEVGAATGSPWALGAAATVYLASFGVLIHGKRQRERRGTK